MENITVSQTDGDYVGSTHSAIQNAIDYVAGEGGGSVFIEAGVYDIGEPIELDSFIELYGEGQHTHLKPDGEHNVIEAEGSEDNELENIYIHDLLIGGDDSVAGEHGIYADYVGKTQSTGDGEHDSSTVGVDEKQIVGMVIENCIVQYCNEDGIRLEGSTANNKIINCVCQNNSDASSSSDFTDGIWNGGNNTIITGNTSQNNGHRGICNFEGYKVIIIGNIFQNNSDHGIENNADHCTITGNTVQNNSDHGIRNRGYNCTITGNTVQNSNGSGIWSSENNSTIIGNTSQNNDHSGIRNDADNCTITGNGCINNDTHGISNGADNSIITGNIAQNNDEKGISTTGNDNCIITANYADSYDISGNNNIDEDNKD